MIELLKYIFSSWPTFLGTIFILALLGNIIKEFKLFEIHHHHFYNSDGDETEKSTTIFNLWDNIIDRYNYYRSKYKKD